MRALQDRLGYTFRDVSLLQNAPKTSLSSTSPTSQVSLCAQTSHGFNSSKPHLIFHAIDKRLGTRTDSMH